MGYFPTGYYGITGSPTPTPTPTAGADTLLRLRYPTGATLYTQIEGGGGVWDGSDYVSFSGANWADYATSTPETPSGSGRYVCQFPIASPPGNYSWSIYLRAGASPAVGDTAIGSGSGYWDGTTFGGASKVTDAPTVELPTPPPDGYGPGGDGSVAVNQDYPTTGNLAFRVSSSGPGIEGASVRAYLAADYTANPNTAPIRGQTVTLDSGAWANNILLDPDDYIIVFRASGYEDTFVELTVS